jgi:hypothetical protein
VTLQIKVISPAYEFSRSRFISIHVDFQWTQFRASQLRRGRKIEGFLVEGLDYTFPSPQQHPTPTNYSTHSSAQLPNMAEPIRNKKADMTAP